MYNRYRGNSGKPQRVEENPPSTVPKPMPVPRKNQSRPPLAGGNLSALLPKGIGKNLSELETEDLLLILILYLMYRESGDKELLLIMGAMYLL
ncbi:MAG: hypothetical protein Q4A83_04905 [Bacillota bacterium]|nr:hypothetical protein [Bacillota bacterium]